MEVQLEEEYDDKQRVLREKRDLESKLMTAQEQVQTQHNTNIADSIQHYTQQRITQYYTI